MAVLGFKKVYIDPIVTGVKQTTLRARKPTYDVGDVVQARCQYGHPPFADLRVTAIEFVDRELLTDADARGDGFGSADELRAALDKTFPGVRHLWLTRFEAREHTPR